LIDINRTTTAQIKKYGKKSLIKWTHISTFYTYSTMIDIKNLILGTTKKAKIDEMVQKFINDGHVLLQRKSYKKLLKKFSNYEIIKKEEKDIIEIEERHYLLDCYNLVLNSSKNKLNFQLPCGTGKTFIMLYIIKKTLEMNNKDKFIIFCPWIELAKQTYKLFKKFKIKTSFIGDGNVNIKKKTQVIICVNPSVIYIEDINFKYKFIDEAHHLENEDSKIREKINQINAEKELNFTATFKNRDEIDYEYTLTEAIKDKYILDFKILIDYITDGNKQKYLIEMIKKKLDLLPAFIYFNSTEKCKKFHELLEENNIKSAYLIGSDNNSKRKKIKKRIINGKIKILCLCGVYNEGISIDCLRTVIFGDLRHSDINKIQISMRANRLHFDKPFYNIIIPIIQSDFSEKYISQLINTFNLIYPNIKENLNNIQNLSRVQINIINNDEVDSELLYTETYNRIGQMLSNNFEYKKNLLFEYCNIYNMAPKNKIKYKNINIGSWLQGIKCKINSKNNNIYKELAKNKIVKENLDLYLLNKENKLSFNEKKDLLFEYCNIYDMAPKNKIKYKDINISKWLQYIKNKINSKNDNIYKELSTNKIVKNSLDLYLLNKENNKDNLNKKLSFNEKKDLLFEYCNIYNMVPKSRTKYKDINISSWLGTIKKKIKFKNNNIYKELAKNKIVKKNLDLYLSYEENKLSFDEKKDLLFKYCNIHIIVRFWPCKFWF